MARLPSCSSTYSVSEASRREFRAHLDEVITLKSRYSTLDQNEPTAQWKELYALHRAEGVREA